MTGRSSTRWRVVVVFAVFVPACGDGPGPATPTSPSSAPAVTTAPATALTIAGPGLVPSGASVKYDVTALLSIGVTIYHVTPTWDTDHPEVAAIGSDGTLTGRRPGIATITAMYREKSATIAVRVSDFAAMSSSGTANLAISFRPDPVPGSLAPCMGAAPSWSFAEAFNETHGIGFTVKAELLNLYRADGSLFYASTVTEEYYFPANSEFVEDICTDLGDSSSGLFEDVVHGIDDRGNELTFRRRVQLLAVAAAPSTSSRTPQARAPGVVARALRRVR